MSGGGAGGGGGPCGGDGGKAVGKTELPTSTQGEKVDKSGPARRFVGRFEPARHAQEARGLGGVARGAGVASEGGEACAHGHLRVARCRGAEDNGGDDVNGGHGGHGGHGFGAGGGRFEEDEDDDGRDVLERACGRGYGKVVQWLVRQGVRVEERHLQAAAGHAGAVLPLLPGAVLVRGAEEGLG